MNTILQGWPPGIRARRVGWRKWTWVEDGVLWLDAFRSKEEARVEAWEWLRWIEDDRYVPDGRET